MENHRIPVLIYYTTIQFFGQKRGSFVEQGSLFKWLMEELLYPMSRCTCIYGNGQWRGDNSEKLTTNADDADVGSILWRLSQSSCYPKNCKLERDRF